MRNFLTSVVVAAVVSILPIVGYAADDGQTILTKNPDDWYCHCQADRYACYPSTFGLQGDDCTELKPSECYSVDYVFNRRKAWIYTIAKEFPWVLDGDNPGKGTICVVDSF